MKLTAIILLIAGLAAAQNTPVFPARAATNGDLFVATNNFATTLLTGITTATATSATVASAAGLTIPAMVTIDTEIFAVCRIAGNTLTFGKSSCPNADGRGYDGSVAVSHVAGRPVEARVVAWLHNQTAAEVIALENSTPAGIYDMGPSLSGACAAASPAPLLLTKRWTGLANNTHLPCDIRAIKGGIIAPANGATVYVDGTFTDTSWSQHVDLSAGGGAQVLFSGGGYLTVDTWGAVSSSGNMVDSSGACSAAYAALSQAPGAGAGVATAALNFKPGGQYNINSCTVKANVHLYGHEAMVTKTGNGTNGIFYAPVLTPPATYVAVILEDLTVIGNPAVMESCLNLSSVQLNGWIRNVTTVDCGRAGIAISAANVYALHQVAAFRNGVNQIVINNSNDVTIDVGDAESGPTAAGALVAVNNSFNTVINKMHCETPVSGVQCIDINNSVWSHITGVTIYYLTTLTSPAAVTITGTSGVNTFTTITGMNAVASGGTVTLSNLIKDNPTGYNVPGSTQTGFAQLSAIGYYTTGSSTLGAPVSLPSGGTIYSGANQRAIPAILFTNCSTGTVCANADYGAQGHIVIGSAFMSAGTSVTVTGISPPFSQVATYSCYAVSGGNNQGAKLVANQSGSSITIEAATANSDLWSYTCVGF